MNYVLIIHEVDDYAAWKHGFDQASEMRRVAGEQSYQVLQFEDEANRVVHFSRWTSLSSAKAFFESAEVRQIREDLGVKAPTFVYLDQTEAGDLGA
ncbi:MAG: antibiotic biosynthesis monooxygenase [Ilumatobacter sp.]